MKVSDENTVAQLVAQLLKINYLYSIFSKNINDEKKFLKVKQKQNLIIFHKQS